MPIRSVGSTPIAAPKTTAAARPPPVRVNWELDAAWKALRMVESDGSSRQGTGTLKEAPVPGWGSNQQPGVNTAFRDQVAPDLKKFVAQGKSSLTPYEATRIAFGLGFGGTYHVEDSEKRRGFTRGDRVELSVTHGGKTETTRAIAVPGGFLGVDSGNQFHFYAPEYDNGTQGRDKVVVNKVLAGALDDGALQAKYG